MSCDLKYLTKTSDQNDASVAPPQKFYDYHTAAAWSLSKHATWTVLIRPSDGFEVEV